MTNLLPRVITVIIAQAGVNMRPAQPKSYYNPNSLLLLRTLSPPVYASRHDDGQMRLSHKKHWRAMSLPHQQVISGRIDGRRFDS